MFPAAALQQSLVDGAGELLESIVLFDRYDKIGDGKISLAFTLSFRASDRTLTGEEISAARESAVANAAKLYGATVHSSSCIIMHNPDNYSYENSYCWRKRICRN